MRRIVNIFAHVEADLEKLPVGGVYTMYLPDLFDFNTTQSGYALFERTSDGWVVSYRIGYRLRRLDEASAPTSQEGLDIMLARLLESEA